MGDRLECDIVMKGGITSGVVYPRAVTELSERYTFRSIGGTSAGAIAAAVTAAAEHDRAGGGFSKVAALPDELGSTPGGRPFTLQLFTPDKKTRALFEAGVGFMLHGKLGGALRLVRWLPRALVPPLAVVLVGILVCVLAGASALWAVVAVLAALLLALVGLVAEALLAARTLTENDFGICHLGPGAGTEHAPALTPWLHKQIQEAAGKTEDDAPLTFADLWGIDGLTDDASDAVRDARRNLIARFSAEPRWRKIDLQMMTTSLSHGRPMRLPAPLDKHSLEPLDGGRLLFSPNEMRRYFPERVVEHLEDHSGSVDDLPQEAHEKGLRHFPIGPDLPVIVATRMSLSFPILITAVTLWELDDAVPDVPPSLKRVVFSDGGITSNFPIHFFDSPAPTRPTFGLQFTDFPAGEGPIQGNPANSVEDPPGAYERMRELRSDMQDLRGFVTAIKDAMQNWRDNTQSQLPGSRERIERIKMGRKEGGLNLTMDETKIGQLTSYGELAGRRLVRLFSGDPDEEPVETQHWQDHRFARYRVIMSALEGLLGDFAYGYGAEPPLATPFEQLIAERTSNGPYAFGSEEREQAASSRSGEYSKLGRIQNAPSLDDENVPRPPARLRAVPPT